MSPEDEGDPDTPEVIQAVEPHEEADTEGTEIPAGSWVISLSNTGKVMTLHLVGSCWRVPGVHYRHFRTMSMEAVAWDLRQNGEYNRVCRECFQGCLPQEMTRTDPVREVRQAVMVPVLKQALLPSNTSLSVRGKYSKFYWLLLVRASSNKICKVSKHAAIAKHVHLRRRSLERSKNKG